ncbi:hypothetical protein FKM82_007611 [Ascaphus truei]
MDKWKDVELEKMKVGGNGKFRQFLESQEDTDPSWSMQEKYNSKAAALYRDKIATLADGQDWSAETSSARNWTPPQPRMMGPSTHRSSAGSAQSGAASGDKAFEDWLNDDVNSYQSGGGVGNQENRYVGFGNTVTPQKKDDDFMNTAMTSLYSGWSSFTVGASKFASAAKDSATKLGSQATQKVILPRLQTQARAGGRGSVSLRLLTIYPEPGVDLGVYSLPSDGADRVIFSRDSP